MRCYWTDPGGKGGEVLPDKRYAAAGCAQPDSIDPRVGTVDSQGLEAYAREGDSQLSQWFRYSSEYSIWAERKQAGCGPTSYDVLLRQRLASGRLT